MRYRPRRRIVQAPGEIAKTALFASLIAGLLASGVAMATAVRNVDMNPKVGDILVYRAGTHLATDWDFTAAIADRPETSCVLKPDTMARSGGSLVVEERLLATQMYRVHWAGVQTSIGGADCGSSAELLVALPDLQLLSNAVGGPGVEHKIFNGL
jgi:hypothetical protein